MLVLKLENVLGVHLEEGKFWTGGWWYIYAAECHVAHQHGVCNPQIMFIHWAHAWNILAPSLTWLTSMNVWQHVKVWFHLPCGMPVPMWVERWHKPLAVKYLITQFACRSGWCSNIQYKWQVIIWDWLPWPQRFKLCGFWTLRPSMWVTSEIKTWDTHPTFSCASCWLHCWRLCSRWKVWNQAHGTEENKQEVGKLLECSASWLSMPSWKKTNMPLVSCKSGMYPVVNNTCVARPVTS